MKYEENQLKSVFSSEGIRRLLKEGGGKGLNDDERALLLALVETDAATGRDLSEKERTALNKLKSQVQDYNADELAQAIEHMVTSKTREEKKMEWPDLKRKRGKAHASED